MKGKNEDLNAHSLAHHIINTEAGSGPFGKRKLPDTFLEAVLPTAVVNTNLLSCNGDGVGFDPQHPEYGKFNPCLCLRSEVVARYFQSYIFEGEITIRFLVYFLALNKILQHPAQTDLQLFN